MRFQDIKKMAKGMDINTYRMKKTDMIRGNIRRPPHRASGTREVKCLPESVTVGPGIMWTETYPTFSEQKDHRGIVQ